MRIVLLAAAVALVGTDASADTEVKWIDADDAFSKRLLRSDDSADVNSGERAPNFRYTLLNPFAKGSSSSKNPAKKSQKAILNMVDHLVDYNNLVNFFKINDDAKLQQLILEHNKNYPDKASKRLFGYLREKFSDSTILSAITQGSFSDDRLKLYQDSLISEWVDAGLTFKEVNELTDSSTWVDMYREAVVKEIASLRKKTRMNDDQKKKEKRLIALME